MAGKGNPKGVNHRRGRAQGAQLVPKVRGAFLRAIAQLEKQNIPLSDILAQQLLENPLGTLSAMAKFLPKEMLVDVPGESGIAFGFVRVPAKESLPEEQRLVDTLDAIDGEFTSLPSLPKKETLPHE